MSGKSTIRFQKAFIEESDSPMFFAGFFRTPPENFHRSEKVSVDIRRSGRKVAIALKELGTGRRVIEKSLYTNKEYTPPIFDEEIVIDTVKSMDRPIGQTPFQDINYLRFVRDELNAGFHEIEAKIRRAVELQCSEVLRSGFVTLIDSAGTALEQFDFKPKATHFPTAGNDWGGAGETPLADLGSLAKVIRIDGKRRVTDAIFGETALDKLLSNADVQARLDNRAMNAGNIQLPVERNAGHLWGRLVLPSNDVINVWAYDGVYEDPATSVVTPYMDPDEVVMIGEGARLDLTYGALPEPLAPDPRVAPLLLGRVQNSAARVDLSTNVWVSPDGRTIHASAGTRPLAQPTQIDAFGTLKTVA